MVRLLFQTIYAEYQKIEMNLISTLIALDQKQKQTEIVHLGDCPQIDEQLKQILHDDSSKLKQIYSLLGQLIQIQEDRRGPKNFRKLLNEISQFIIKYSYDRIQAFECQIVILNLTYYQKTFKSTMSVVNRIEVSILLAIANLNTFIRSNQYSTESIKRLRSAQDKIQQATTSLVMPSNLYQNIFSLLAAIVTHLKGQRKKAKTLLANLFPKIMTQSKQVLKDLQILEIMAICAYYSYANLYQLGEEELAYYYLTKAFQYGKKIGQKAVNFVQKIKQIGGFKAYRVVRLTRIQNKLQVLNRRTKSSWQTKPRIYHKKNEINPIEKGSQQLKNLFTIKDTKATMYKFRKDNLRYLQNQQNKLRLSIEKNKAQLENIKENRVILQQKQELIAIQKRIQMVKECSECVKQDYQMLMEKHMGKLNQVKVINKYMQALVTKIHFEKAVYVYNFLYGQMISKAKIFILSLFIKRRIKKIKKTVKNEKIMYRGIMHYVQLFQIMDIQTQLVIYKKKQPGYYIKIFPIQSKPGLTPVQDQRKLTPQQLHKLTNIPFYYQFDSSQGRLLNWSQYTSQLKNITTIYCINKMLWLASKRYKNRPVRDTCKKYSVSVKFGDHVSTNIVLFICIRKIQRNCQFLTVSPVNQKYQAYIYTIGGQKYVNPVYNVRLDTMIQTEHAILSKNYLQQLVKHQLISNFQQRINKIIQIQRFMRLIFSKKQLQKLKLKNKIVVFINLPDVITYCRYPQGKYIIVENLQTRERQGMETMLDHQAFKFVHLIKNKLGKQRNYKDKIKMICKFLWTKYFVGKLKSHYKGASVMTDFQLSFRNRIILTKQYPTFIYKRRLQYQSLYLTLCVQSLLQFPRPYILRLFTIANNNDDDLNSSIIIDVSLRILNRQKLYYQKNVDNLNKIINFVARNQIQIMGDNQQIEVDKKGNKSNKRRNSNNNNGSRRSSFNSRRGSRGSSKPSFIQSFASFDSDDQQRADQIGTQIIPKMITKKTSMLQRFKNRRSSLLKNVDVLIRDSPVYSINSLSNQIPEHNQLQPVLSRDDDENDKEDL